MKKLEEETKPIEKEKPCFIPSGILAEYQNKVNGVTLKFTEPIDAAPPTETFALYQFVDGEIGKSFTLKARDNGTSAFLVGCDE